jgi:hypothetical protein
MYQVRKWQLFAEEILANETGQAADGAPVRRIAVAAVLQNPYAGRFSAQLNLLTDPSPQLGSAFARRLVAALGGDRAESYGKACIVGMEGEYEHGNALLTTAFADPVRDALAAARHGSPPAESAARPAPRSTCPSRTRTRCTCARTTTR